MRSRYLLGYVCMSCVGDGHSDSLTDIVNRCVSAHSLTDEAGE